MQDIVNNKKEKQRIDNNSLVVRKSNAFITSKYKSSLLENQIVSFSLTRIEFEKEEPVSRMSAKEICDIFGYKNDGNFYRKLKKASQNMPGHVIFIENGEGDFISFSMIPNVEYISGELTIHYNKQLAPHIGRIEGPHTTYLLANASRLKSDYTFRIYEVLRKEAYRITKETPVIMKEYGLSEFKCIIGVVNTDEAGVRHAKNSGASWDHIVENVAKEKSFSDWYNFKRSVLDRAKKEMEKVCDLKFEYDDVRTGLGGKVKRIKFYISKNTPDKELDIKANEIQDIMEKRGRKKQALPQELFGYIGHNDLTEKDLLAICDAAKGDTALVQEAIEAADKNYAYIDKYVGWIITYIRNGGYSDIHVVNGSSADGSRLSGIMADMEKERAKPNSRIKQNVWNKIKKKDDYSEFIKEVQQYGIEEIELESIYSAEEKVALYIEWTQGKELSL